MLMSTARSTSDIGPVLGEDARRYISACDYAENADYILFLNELEVRTNLSTAGVIVDIGSGPGTLCSLIAVAHPSARTVGIDASAQMIEYSKRKYSNASFCLGDAEHLPFR